MARTITSKPQAGNALGTPSNWVLDPTTFQRIDRTTGQSLDVGQAVTSHGITSAAIPMSNASIMKPATVVEAAMRKAGIYLYQSSLVIDEFAKVATKLSEEDLKRDIKAKLTAEMMANILQNITFTRKDNPLEFNSVIAARCFIFTKEQLEELLEFAVKGY